MGHFGHSLQFFFVFEKIPLDHIYRANTYFLKVFSTSKVSSTLRILHVVTDKNILKFGDPYMTSRNIFEQDLAPNI